MAKMGLAKTKDAPYDELKEYGYDPKSSLREGLKGAAKGASMGAQIGSAGGIPGIAAGMAIGAGIGFVGGFQYDMITGGDNLSTALNAYKLDKKMEKETKKQRNAELAFLKSTKEKQKRASDLPRIPGDEIDTQISSLAKGTTFDRFKDETYPV